MKSLQQLTTLLLPMLILSLSAQDGRAPEPTVQDLDFLIGKWEITFDLYNAKDPERGVVSSEEGFQVCEYGLSTDGVPMFIICTGQVTNEKGRTRSFQESIRYSRFENSYVRHGLFSHWPSASHELLTHDKKKRIISISGSLGYSRGRTEKYQDVIEFDKTFETYSRTHRSHLSDMPEGEFNLGLTGTARKIK